MQVSTTWALTCPETVHRRPCVTREIETWLSDSRVGNNSVVDHRSRRPVVSPLRNCVHRFFLCGVNAAVVSRPGRRRHSSSRSTMSSRAVRHQTRHGCSVTRPPRRRRFVARSSIVLYNSRAVKRTFLRFRF